MDTSSLSIFVDVVRRGSFVAVARHRNVDPSSISRTVAALEDELGVRLFLRTTRRLSPTEAGRVYFRDIEPIVESLAQAQQAVRDVNSSPSGRIRVTTSVAFGKIHLLPLLPELQRLHPGLSVDLVMSDATFDLLADRIDVAIRIGTQIDGNYVSTKLFPAQFRVCASPGYLDRTGYPPLPSDVGQRDCLLFDLPGNWERWCFRRDGEEQHVQAGSRLRCSSGLAVREAALAGMGIALLPNWMIGGDLADGALIDLFPDHAVSVTDKEIAVWILYPGRPDLPVKVRCFIDFVKQRLGRLHGRPLSVARQA